MEIIEWNDFEKIALHVGTIIEVEDFPEARKPAYKVTVDFGKEIGIKKTSAQIVENYTKEELLDQQIIGVVNFSEKQIGPFMSQFLLTGFEDEEGKIVISQPQTKVPNGAKMY
ncbi:protein CsaA [Flavobacteriaceae bacterium UJ101]|nr:protein CsaA [Flavobacteriaceae bacterium UJ101]